MDLRRGYHAANSADDLISRNVSAIRELEAAAQNSQTRANRVADLITSFCGSMAFVWVHVAWFALWVLANTIWGGKHFDPFPFNFLTLVVSLEAIFLSTFILISENRQAKIDERRSHLDLQINLLSEQENTKMLQLLKQIAEKLDIDPGKDPTVAVLEQATRLKKSLLKSSRWKMRLRNRIPDFAVRFFLPQHFLNFIRQPFYLSPFVPDPGAQKRMFKFIEMEAKFGSLS